jgi:hypothetical protein
MSNLCLTGDSAITVSINGTLATISLEEVVSHHNNGATIQVLCRDLDGSQDLFSLVTNAALMNSEADVLEIQDEDSGLSIECTEDHLIFTNNRGYVAAKDLTENDSLLIFQ